MVVDMLERDGLFILENAVSVNSLRAEVDRRRQSLSELRQMFQDEQRKGWRGPVQVREPGRSLIIDHSSVVCEDKNTDPSITLPTFRLLAKLRLALNRRLGNQLENGGKPRFSAFANFYMNSKRELLVEPHVDRSLLTALSSATCLVQADLEARNGLEYKPPKMRDFVPIVTSTVNALIVMCGQEVARSRRNTLGFPGLVHQVRGHRHDEGRFSLVFKVHAD